jgi:protease I
MARVAMLVADDFEDVEVRVPLQRLREAGHDVVLAGAEAGTEVAGKRGEEKVSIEVGADELEPSSVDALVIPGGYAPDKLRTDDDVVDFTRKMFDSGRPVAAVCHAPSLLIEAGVVEGATLTSWPSIRTDLENAGANWVDEEVVIDRNLITSRKPDDLEAFSDAVIEAIE